MLRLRQLGLIVATVSVALVASMTASIADPGGATHVDGVTATVDAAGVAVSGSATFVDTPFKVQSVDWSETPHFPNDDFTSSTDFKNLTIARPDPFGETLQFTIEVWDPNRTGPFFTTPELVTVFWEFMVTEPGGDSTFYQVLARRTDVLTTTVRNRAPSAEAQFYVQLCAGKGDCPDDTILADATTVTGAMRETNGGSEGAYEWEVPFSAVGATVGSRIDTIVYGAWLSAGGAHMRVRNHNVHSDCPCGNDRSFRTYTVPGPIVRLGIAPAGTAVGDVALTVDGTVQPDGAISGRIPTPAQPGDYVVVVQACNGAGNCGLASTTLVV